MKKHILGIGVFVSIVGAAIFVAGFRDSNPDLEIFGRRVSNQSERRTSCFPKMKKSRIEVNQAVFDLPSKELKISYSLTSEIDKKSDVIFNIFTKDGENTRYIASEGSSFETANQKSSAIFTDKMFDEIKPSDNLYIVAEIVNFPLAVDKYKPTFDAENAVPVLLSKGKDF